MCSKSLFIPVTPLSLEVLIQHTVQFCPPFLSSFAVRAGLLELKLQNYGELEIRGGDTASIGVVRPIPLSQEGGAQAGRG